MKNMRCDNCKKLLAKVEEAKYVEIKCPRCKTLNQLKAKSFFNSKLKGDKNETKNKPQT